MPNRRDFLKTGTVVAGASAVAGVDGELDALRALVAIAQPTDRGSLADALDAVVSLNPDKDDGLAVHGRHCEHMRPDRRHIDNQGINADRSTHHTDHPQISLSAVISTVSYREWQRSFGS